MASATSRRSGAVGSGVVTALSTVAVSAAAAGAAILLAHRFGRANETDGFFAAYAVYLVLALAAQASRVVVLPPLARAESEGRLGAELRAQATALFAIGLLLWGTALVTADAGGELLTVRRAAAAAFADALPPLVVAGVLQLTAALLASGLAARGSYGVAAAGYAVGAAAGLGYFAARPDDGVEALAWGLVLNGAIATALPLLALLRGHTPATLLPEDLEIGRRLARLLRGVALPISLQGLYVIANAFAARLGSGEVTTFGYAYFAAAFLVAATASSLSLVSSAPLTRRGIDAVRASDHVVHASWLSLVPIVAATGFLALSGADLFGAVLGDAFAGDEGRKLGRLVAYLAPWAFLQVALSLAFPLLFVVDRQRALVPLAIALPLAQVPVAWALARTWGLAGVALSLTATTLAALTVVLAAIAPGTLARAARGLAAVAAFQATLAAAAFAPAALVVDGIAAAAAGLALYLVLVAAARPRGLRDAWRYVRTLE